MLFRSVNGSYGIFIYFFNNAKVISNSVLNSHGYGIMARLCSNISITDNVVNCNSQIGEDLYSAIEVVKSRNAYVVGNIVLGHKKRQNTCWINNDNLYF